MATAASLLLLVPFAHAADRAANAQSGPLLIAFLVACVVVAAVILARDALNGLLVTAGMGALTTVYLTVQHFVALRGGNSICNISGVINCDLVNTSKYSELGGVAISLYGLGFYAAMGYLAFRQRAGRTQVAAPLLLTGAVLAVGYDAFLAHASYQLGAICLFCATSWALNILLLAGSAKLVRKMESGFGESLGKSFASEAGPAAAMGLVVFVVGLVVARGGSASETQAGGGDSASYLGSYEKIRGPVVVDGTEPVKGDPAARFTIVEFADYQCPHCGLMAPTLHKLLDENKDVKLIFKHYPISEGCNANVQGDRHPLACNAAASAECARLQGRFWELSDQMFKNQEYLAPDDISFMAQKQGIDVPSLELCRTSAAAMDAVKEDIVAASSAQIDGTPSLFLLGAFGDQWVKWVVGPEDGDKMSALIAAAREGKQLPEPPEPAPYPE